MRRACKVTLKFATAAKLRKVAALLESYRAAVNFYIRSLWVDFGRLDKDTLARLQHTRLSERYKSAALKQALETVISTKKASKAIGKAASVPVFTGAATLDAKFVAVKEADGQFDLAILLSVLKKGKRLWLPTKATAVLRKWLSIPGAKIIDGGALSENSIVIWVDVPDAPEKTKGRVFAVDIGANKMLSDSDGFHHGTEFKGLRDKIGRKKKGSAAKQRAIQERDNYINFTVKRLPWDNIKTIGVEDLKNVKKGKQKKRSKAFRKAMAPWTYGSVLTKLEQCAQENGVRLVRVPAAYTSQTCPTCGTVSKKNRCGEKFKCVFCGRSGDSDRIAALNILARTQTILGSVESPRLQRTM